MDVQIKVWDLPKTKEEVIRFLQDVAQNKTVRQCTQHDFRWECERATLIV